ncbi:hypothetical protein Hamer_G010327 [Homarus americanus]|uniref:Uncharacterized protein n=1 Tax=Homarus americanus TaxID=6706 RepID=A0A8J5JZU4_HOMAM|nr:hypothetical protein Hamer_G010327 [Homarus americanus]
MAACHPPTPSRILSFRADAPSTTCINHRHYVQEASHYIINYLKDQFKASNYTGAENQGAGSTAARKYCFKYGAPIWTVMWIMSWSSWALHLQRMN